MSEEDDRRRAPRYKTRFRIRDLHREEEPPKPASQYCETRNISRNGAYCLSTQEFPEFVRIRINLELNDENEPVNALQCEGVVVRADGKVKVDGKEMYAFAVFFDRMSEEHGVLEVTDPSCDLKVGDRAEIIPIHICTSVNLWDELVGLRGDRVELTWPVRARGRVK